MQFNELPEKVTVLIARLSYNGTERVEIANWLVQTAIELHNHPRVANVFHKIMMGYPTPRIRNSVMKLCREKGIHFAVMIDDDTVPDVHSPGAAVGYEHLPKMRDQQNFFPAALDFALEHPGPCVIGAPYCAGPPEERVLVSRFREKQSDDPSAHCNGGLKLECFTRDEAAPKTGFEMVSALPTGLILIDMRVCAVLKPPYFDYEYRDEEQTELASTEDTVFSRNALYLGVPQYVAWQSWCAHLKIKAVGRPRKYPLAAVPAQVNQSIREGVERERREARPADQTNPAALRYVQAIDGDDAPPAQPLPEEGALGAESVGEPPCAQEECDTPGVCDPTGRCQVVPQISSS